MGVIWTKGSLESDKCLVQGELREEVLALVNDIHSSGHQGVQRTKLRARENFCGGWGIVLGVMFLLVKFVATN